MKYLRERHPENIYVNVFEEYGIGKVWRDPDFELDGLIYDQTANIFYMVKAKYHLTQQQLSKTEETLRKFCEFVHMDQPDKSDRKSRYRWNAFFGYEAVVQTDVIPCVSVFLAFHESESDDLITAAKSKDFILIGPEGYLYKVLN